MVTGSFASGYHGEARASQDIDIVIAPTVEQLRGLVAGLSSTEYYVDAAAAQDAFDRDSQFNVIDLATGWKVDFIIRKSRPFSREEFARRMMAEVSGVQVYMTTAEDIAIAKMEWSRLGGSQRQLEDAASILRMHPDLDRNYIARWIEPLGIEVQWAEVKALAGD
jgi:hypothetical protein